MILTEAEVLELVKKPVDSVIAINRDLQLRHKLHITGEGVLGHISHLEDYETKKEFDLRKKDIEDFTRLITNEIIDAQSRWKSAQGTTKYYNFGTNGDKLAEEFKKEILSQVWKGGSMEVFIKQFLASAIYEEFNGFFLIEKGAVVKNFTADQEYTYEVKEGISTRIDPNAKLKPYIVFKCVDEVTQFRVTGKRVEYIVLHAGFVERNNKKIPLFRVIDDVTDYIVELDGTIPTISTEHLPIKHNAGKCPVVRVSTLRKYISNDKTLTSAIDNLLGTLDNLLTLYIDHATTARKHGFPLMWMVGTNCMYRNEHVACNDGWLRWSDNGTEHEHICPSCKGKKAVKTDPSSVLLIPATDAEGKAFSIGVPGGFINRDIETFIQQRDEINWQIQALLSAATGMKNGLAEQSVNKTATEIVMNTKPLEDIISENIDIIESVEKDLTDLLGKIYYEEKYLGCEIIYGRKLNLRDENAIIAEIKESKAAGCSFMYIKALFEELVYSRFIRSNIDLQRNLMLIELEPLIGFTIDEVSANASIQEETKTLKINFIDLINRFEQEYEALENYKPNMPFKKRVKEIKARLDVYVLEISNSGTETDEDSLGKIPLALQQLALARERANTAGDSDLSERIGKKMDELLLEIL